LFTGSAFSLAVDSDGEVAVVVEADSPVVPSADVPAGESAGSAAMAPSTMNKVGKTARAANLRYADKRFRIMAGIQSEILGAVKERLRYRLQPVGGPTVPPILPSAETFEVALSTG
jgi:hypothetical protein